MGKKVVGLTGWIRDINNTWAEQFDVRDVDDGPQLIALSSSERTKTVLVTVSDVDKGFAEKERPENEDRGLRGTQVLLLMLQALPRVMANKEFVVLEDLLVETVAKYCQIKPYPTFEMICAKGKIELFEIE